MDKDPLQILVLDRNRHNLTLLTQFLEQQGYQVLPALCLEDVASALNSMTKINLALIDISGFDSSIWEVCQQLCEQEIPFLVISARHHAAIQQASIAHGALGLLNKPIALREFLQLIRELLR
ncbi:response regulator transcription factor [Phormidesmis priestleyi]